MTNSIFILFLSSTCENGIQASCTRAKFISKGSYISTSILLASILLARMPIFLQAEFSPCSAVQSRRDISDISKLRQIGFLIKNSCALFEAFLSLGVGYNSEKENALIRYHNSVGKIVPVKRMKHKPAEYIHAQV